MSDAIRKAIALLAIIAVFSVMTWCLGSSLIPRDEAAWSPKLLLTIFGITVVCVGGILLFHKAIDQL